MTTRATRPRSSSILAILAVGIVFLLFGCGGGGGGGDTGTGTSSDTAGYGSISGLVIDGPTGAAVANATITVDSLSAITGANGTYSLTNVGAGTRLVVASRSDLGSRSAVVFLTANQVTTVNFVMGTNTTTGGSTTGPIISSSNPSNNATNADVNTQILFTLDQSIQRSTLATNVRGTGYASVIFTRVTTPSQTDSGVCTVRNFTLANTYIYQPGSLLPLQPGCQYSLYVSNRLIGSNGVPSPGSGITFKTAGSSGGGSTSVGGPKLSYTNPPDKATNVDLSSRIIFGFNQAMTDSSVLTAGNVLLARMTSPAQNTAGTVVKPTDLTGLSNVYEFIPAASVGLTSETTYCLFITNKVVSSTNIPSTGESFSFSTRKETGEGAPIIVASNPADKATNVDPYTRIFITLSANVDCQTVTPTSVRLTRLTSPVQDMTINVSSTCAAGVSTNVFEITGFTSPLSGNCAYQVSINNNVKSTTGVRSSGSVISFTTRSSSSGGGGTVAPVLVASNPANGAVNVDPSTDILLTFNVPIDLTSFTGSMTISKVSTPVQEFQHTINVTDTGLSNTYRLTKDPLDTFQSQTKYRVYLSNKIHATGGYLQPTTFDFTIRQVGGGILPPTLVYKNPPNKATGVDISTQILFAFDQAMTDSSVMNPSNVILSQLSTPVSNVSGTIFKRTDISTISNLYQFLPSVGLSSETTYALVVTNKVTSSAGVPSAGESFSFKTGVGQGQESGPVIVSSNPSNNSVDVDPYTRVLLTLSSNVSPDTVTNESVKLTKLTSPVQVFDSLTITKTNSPVFELGGFTSPLTGNSVYEVSINNKVLSNSGTPSQGSAIHFLTRASSDSGSWSVIPRLVSSNPSNQSTGVDVGTAIYLTFNVPIKNVNAATGLTGCAMISQISSPVQDLLGDSDLRITRTDISTMYRLEPVTGDFSSYFKSLSKYRVYLKNTIQADGANGGYLEPTSFEFTTRQTQGGAGDTTAPKLLSTNPSNGTTGVYTGVDILFWFDEKVETSTVTSTSVILSQVSGITSMDRNQRIVALDSTNCVTCTNCTANVSCATAFQYYPGTLALSPGQTFRLSFGNQIKDLNGNRLAPTSIQFSTANIQDIPQGPRIVSANPTMNQTGVDPSTTILFTFDKDIYPPGNTENVSVSCTVTPTTVILARVTAPAENDGTVTITPTSAVTLTPACAVPNDAICDCSTYGQPCDCTIDVQSGDTDPVHFSSLPFIFRPDPINFPKTFRYIPGTLPLQSGPTMYTLFVTNGVRDYQGNAAQGDAISFSTRSLVVSPATGPRLVATNPGNGAFAGVNSWIYLVFDKPVDPNSLYVSATVPAIDISALAIVPSAMCSDQLTACDLRSTDMFQCTFNVSIALAPYPDGLSMLDDYTVVVKPAQPNGLGGLTTRYCLIVDTDGNQQPATQIVAVPGTIFINVTNRLKSRTDGSLAPGDSFFFFVR